jgi:hypothetical protein
MKVLEGINLEIRDTLKIDQAVGTHDGSNNTIDLDQSTMEDYFMNGELSPKSLNLITHEVLHAISSGQIVIHHLISKYKDGGMNWTDSSYPQPQWSGLKTNGFNVSRFTWLNEAVTENLSAHAVETKPSAYPDERKLLELLMTKGKKVIDKKVLTNAYFERRGYQANDNEGQKFWNLMRQEIRESYDHDPQFLIKLDILIQNKGIEEAIKLLENWNPNDPKYIDIAEIEGKKKPQEEQELAKIRSDLGIE